MMVDKENCKFVKYPTLHTLFFFFFQLIKCSMHFLFLEVLCK